MGLDPAEVARLTGVPLPLLHLGVASPGADRAPRPSARSRRAGFLIVLHAVMTANLVLVVVAAMLDLPVLLLVSLLLTLALFVAVAVATGAQRDRAGRRTGYPRLAG